jgi:hypothetical protein
MTLRLRIRSEKTSWRWLLSFTIVNVFFHARNRAFFMREMLVLRIINREDDHFDRFKIQIEFFVWFFLKFIENDHLSWMKNAVNRKLWMRKWIVKKTKMKCKKIFDLKEDFFSSFLIKLFFRFVFQFCYSLYRFFLSAQKIFFEVFVMSFMWDSFSTRTRNRNVVKDVSNFWSRILFSNAFLTWIMSFAIVANVLILFVWW